MNAFLERANIFAESSYHEYEHNLNQIEVKIMTEAGTDEDKDELGKAANSAFIERTKKFIEKLVETIVTHIASIGSHISEFFNQAKVKLVMKKVLMMIINV